MNLIIFFYDQKPKKIATGLDFEMIKVNVQSTNLPPQKIRFIYCLVMKTHNLIHIQLSVPLCTY